MIKVTPSSFEYNKCTKAVSERVYHLRFDISEYSKQVNGEEDKEMTNFALSRIDECLEDIKYRNKSIVIRFSYDPGYNGNKNKEPSLQMIETHIKQISHYLNKDKFYNTIIAIEGGMLGPWGEMHSSDIATEENKAKVIKYWLENTNNIPILARTPKAIFTYFGKSLEQMENYDIIPQEKGYKLGLFNDCYLSSNSDVGTYLFDREREVNWLSKQNEHLPYGGETCKVDNMSDLDKAIPEMYKLGLSYLNLYYNKDVINKWKNLEYDSSLGKDSLFYGMSGFDYIKVHMGYRLVLRSLKINYTKGDKYDLTITIENLGFGNVLKEKSVNIIYTSMNNNIIKTNNVGKYKGEKELIIKGELLPEDHDNYKVFIKIYGLNESDTDKYYLQFANDDVFNEDIKATYLFKVLKGGEIQK